MIEVSLRAEYSFDTFFVLTYLASPTFLPSFCLTRHRVSLTVPPILEPAVFLFVHQPRALAPLHSPLLLQPGRLRRFEGLLAAANFLAFANVPAML